MRAFKLKRFIPRVDELSIAVDNPVLHGKLVFHLDVDGRRLGVGYGHIDIDVGSVLGAWIVGRRGETRYVGGVASIDALDHAVV